MDKKELNKFDEHLKRIRIAKTREFHHAHVEYYQLLIKHYNENPLNAFTTFVHLRNELKSRIPDRRHELDCFISEVVDDAKKFNPNESLLQSIKDLLNRWPNLDLYDELNLLIANNCTSDDEIYNRFPHYSMNAIDTIVTFSRDLRMSMILYNVVFSLVNDIADFALPIEFSLNEKLVTLDAFRIEIPIEKPDKEQKYVWYEKFYQENEDEVEAFKKLIKKIEDIGMTLSEFNISTKDPINFHRSYTKWFNKRKRSSK